MSCCDDFGNCDQGRNCPVRAPAKVATAKPLYRRCDVGGICPRPDAKCQAECLLSAEPDESIGWLESAVMWALLSLAVGLLLVLLGGAAGFVYGWLA